MEELCRQERHYALIEAAQSADLCRAEEATACLMSENMGLVRNAALRFRDRGTEYEDLLQIGSIGMLRAIRTFDLSRGTAFSTFAVPLIVGEIRRHLRDDGLLHVSRNDKRLGAALTAKRREILEREGRDPTLEELATALDVSAAEAAAALGSISPVASLSECAFEEEKGELSERITDDESANEPAILSDRIALRAAISQMPTLWRKILLLRYYRNCTQQQTADALGLSQVKVSREEKKIIEFLRGEMIV